MPAPVGSRHSYKAGAQGNYRYHALTSRASLFGLGSARPFGKLTENTWGKRWLSRQRSL
jgi:hypothetical protein